MDLSGKWINGRPITRVLLLSLFIVFTILLHSYGPELSALAYKSNSEHYNSVKLSLYKSQKLPKQINNDKQITWNNMRNGRFNLGADPFALIRVELPPSSQSVHGNYVIALSRNNIFTAVTLHYFNNLGLQSIQLKSTTTDKKLLSVALPILEKQQPIFLSVSGRYLRGQLQILSQTEFNDLLKSSSALNGLYYGIFLLFLFLSVTFSLHTKNAVYIAYTAIFSCMGVWIAAGEGWLKTLFPDTYLQPFFTANSLGLLFFISFAIFSKQFLRLSMFAKRINTLLSGSQVLLAALWIAYICFFNNTPSAIYQFFYAMALLCCFLVAFSAVVGAYISMNKGNKQATLYLLAVSVLFVCSTLVGLSISSLIESHYDWTLIKVASLIDISLLAIGFIYWQKKSLDEKYTLGLNVTTLRKELEESKSSIATLHKNISNHSLSQSVVQSLSPDIAKVISLLESSLYIKANGNYATVYYQSGKKLKEAFVDCNLQDIAESLGSELVIRCHKSFLVLPNIDYRLNRRTSADYDLIFENQKVPVGRKYLSNIKTVFVK
jgi:hypothetical protein